MESNENCIPVRTPSKANIVMFVFGLKWNVISETINLHYITK